MTLLNTAIWTVGFIVCTWITLKVSFQIFYALQVLIVPNSLRGNRELFEKGMGTLLFVRSFGTLSSVERAQIIDGKWDTLS